MRRQRPDAEKALRQVQRAQRHRDARQNQLWADRVAAGFDTQEPGAGLVFGQSVAWTLAETARRIESAFRVSG